MIWTKSWPEAPGYYWARLKLVRENKSYEYPSIVLVRVIHTIHGKTPEFLRIGATNWEDQSAVRHGTWEWGDKVSTTAPRDPCK